MTSVLTRLRRGEHGYRIIQEDPAGRDRAVANPMTIVERLCQTLAQNPSVTSEWSSVVSVVPIGDIRCLPAVASAKARNPRFLRFNSLTLQPFNPAQPLSA
jgi:hypothetical protein